MVAIIQNDFRVPAGISGEISPSHVVCAYAQQPFPDLHTVDSVVVLGGYMSYDDDDKYPYLQEVKRFIASVIKQDVPMLGICLGAQMIADVLGSAVHHNRGQEQGLNMIQLTQSGSTDPLFNGLPATLTTFQWHHDSFDLPTGATQIAYSAQCSTQAFHYQQTYGVQFHPEVTPTIVKDWCQCHGGCDALLRDFIAENERYRQQHRRLLNNFYLNSCCQPGSRACSGERDVRDEYN